MSSFDGFDDTLRVVEERTEVKTGRILSTLIDDVTRFVYVNTTLLLRIKSTGCQHSYAFGPIMHLVLNVHDRNKMFCTKPGIYMLYHCTAVYGENMRFASCVFVDIIFFYQKQKGLSDYPLQKFCEEFQ